MNDENKTAAQWQKIMAAELSNLVNQHYQISQASSFHESLPTLAARIQKVAAVCETWRAVAKYNATQKFFKGG